MSTQQLVEDRRMSKISKIPSILYAFAIVSLRFGNLLYPTLVIATAAAAAAAAAREGSESVQRATKLRRGSPEGADEREIEEGLEGGLIRGWRRCWSWRWVEMLVMVVVMAALAVRDGNGRLAGPLVWITHAEWRHSPALPGYRDSEGEGDTLRSGLRISAWLIVIRAYDVS